MILNVRKRLEIYETQFEQWSWSSISAELCGKGFTRKGGGESLRKIFFEIFQSQLKGFIRIPDFTNFPASTGFLVMEKKELPL